METSTPGQFRQLLVIINNAICYTCQIWLTPRRPKE